MFVTDWAIGNKVYGASSMKDKDCGKVDDKRSAIQQLRAISGLCNAAEFDAASSHQPLAERRIFGDATDQAILRFSERFGSVTAIRQEWKSVFELGFDSKRKFMIKAATSANASNIGTGISSLESANFLPGTV